MQTEFETTFPKSQHECGQSRPCRDIIIDFLKPRGRTNRTGMQSEFMKVVGRRRQVFGLFRDLCHEVGHKIVDPVSLPMPASVDDPYEWILRDNQDWADNLVDQLKYDKVGRWRYTGDRTIQYEYFQVSKSSGWWQNDHERIKTVHDVIKARVRRLPCNDLPKPPKAERMIKRIMQEKNLYKHFGIITGTLVAHGSEVTEQWKTDTQLKKGVEAVTSMARSAGGAVVSAATFSMSMMASLASDPAIICGDTVWFGWR